MSEHILSRLLARVYMLRLLSMSRLQRTMAMKLKNSELDLVVLREGLEPRQWPAVEVWRSPLKWITSEKHQQPWRRSACCLCCANPASRSGGMEIWMDPSLQCVF